MALIFSLQQSSVGVPFDEAYARILNFDGDRDGIRYYVTVHANKNARDSGLAIVAHHHFWCPLPTGELLPELYAHLKSQPGFETAKDC
jgi:hypothetical protein